MTQYKGSTEEAGGQFLGASFWKKGTRVEGKVTGLFGTENGTCYSVHLNKAVKVNDETTDKVSIGALKGFEMAIRASGAGELSTDDLIILECTGTVPTTKGNDQVNFKLLVDRKNF